MDERREERDGGGEEENRGKRAERGKIMKEKEK